MFTGLIKNMGVVKDVSFKNKGARIAIKTNLKVSKKDIGSSINCSGVCLTLENFRKKICFFYLSKETINKSIFKYIKLNQSINLEKSLKYGDEISGHFVQGHVDTIAKLKDKKILGKSWHLNFLISKKFTKYIAFKSSIGINGVSLTVNKIANESFSVVIIPHTLKMTNLYKLKINDYVNIEIDIIAKYLKQFGK